MLKRSSDAIVKWKGFDQAIDRWLDERHKLILQLSDFAADHNFSLCTPEVEDKLRAFIAQLIDYVSAGHFEFYQRLADEGREFDDVEALANIGSLLEAIDISTQCALDFNEKYEQIADLSECVADISDLAETLVTRFDAEDQMINSLHRAHLRQITA